jgi:hypothetical protein
MILSLTYRLKIKDVVVMSDELVPFTSLTTVASHHECLRS